MKNKCIWPVALPAVAGAGLWHFLEVQEGAVAVGDAWMRGWYLALLTAVLVFLAGAGLAFSGKSPASFSVDIPEKVEDRGGLETGADLSGSRFDSGTSLSFCPSSIVSAG